MPTYTANGTKYNITVGSTIGEGSTSIVRRATGEPLNWTNSQSRSGGGGGAPQTMLLVVKRAKSRLHNDDLWLESSTLRRLRPGNPAVVMLLGSYSDLGKRTLALFPRASATLSSMVRGRTEWDDGSAAGKEPLAKTAAMVGMAARGVAFLQSRRVIHRDVAPGNVGVDSSGRTFLLDFGSALLLDDDEIDDFEWGTSGHHAAEILYESKGDHSRCDMFSIGTLLGHCVRGISPFLDREDSEHQNFSHLVLTSPEYKLQQIRRMACVLGSPSTSDVAELQPQRPELASDVRAGGKARSTSIRELYGHRCSDANARRVFLEVMEGLLVYAPSERMGAWEVLLRLLPLVSAADRRSFFSDLTEDEKSAIRRELGAEEANQLLALVE